MNPTDQSTRRLAQTGCPPEAAQAAALSRAKAKLLGGRTAPSRVGRYEVRKLIAAGGMGEVYRGFDPELARDVAVKIIAPSEGANAAEAQARLFREARAVAALAHPNVVAIHDVGSIDRDEDAAGRQVYLVMELIEGVDLRRWLGDAPRTQAEIIDVFLAAGEGLLAAHRAGLVHRDLKPGNIVIDDSGRVRLVDFGLASAPKSHVLGGDDVLVDDDPRSAALATESGAVVGTPAYMAPEQYAGRGCDHLSDQYSFCLALANSASGRFVFDGRTPLDLQQAKAQQAFDLGAGRRLARGLRRLLRRGLRGEPSERYPDVETLLNDLRRVRGGPRRWAIATGLAGTSLAVVGAFAWPSLDDPCDAATHRMKTVWSDSTRGRLSERFEATGAPFAADAWTRVQQDLDAVAIAWTAAYAEHCRRDTEGADAEAARAHEASCLERDYTALAEALGVLGEPLDVAAVQRAPGLVHRLRRAQTCLGSLPPGEPHIGVLPDSTERSLLRANALLALGQLEAATKLATPAVRVARDTGRHRLGARGELLLVRIAAWRRNRPLAAQHAYRAAFLAERAGGTELVLEANIRLLRALALERRFEEAADASARCDALIDEGAPEGLVARHRLNVAMLALGRDGPAAALVPLSVAEHALRQAYGPKHINLAELSNARGAALRRLERFDEARAAFEEALAIADESVGPQHPNNIVYRGNLGALLARADRPSEALPHFEQALELASWAHGSDSLVAAERRSDVGWALAQLGRWSAAKAVLDEALAIQQQVAPDSVGTADTQILLANIEVERGHPQNAVDRLTQARDIVAAKRGHDHADTAKVEDELASARALLHAD